MQTDRSAQRPLEIVLLGANGQVGWELQRALSPLGTVHAFDRTGIDLTDARKLLDAIRRIRPRAIVNAAAYTAVDRAEAEPDQAAYLNAEIPSLLAQEAARLNAWLLHYSTDYVFDGSGDEFRAEDAPPCPINVYGQTKWAGEQKIQRSGCLHLIVRTSWVYGSRGQNFPKAILELARKRQSLRVIADQFGAPTGADLIADLSAHMLSEVMRSSGSSVGGTYHAVAAGEVSWWEYARYVIGSAAKRGQTLCALPQNIEAIRSEEYICQAKRPLNSRLSTTKLQNAFGLHLPPWQQGVDRLLCEWLD